MTDETRMPRRDVKSGYRTGGFSSNMYRVQLSCGHEGYAQGYLGRMPKTSGCFECLKLRRKRADER